MYTTQHNFLENPNLTLNHMKYLPCKSSLSNKKLQLFSMFKLKIFIVQFIVHRNLQSICRTILEVFEYIEFF